MRVRYAVAANTTIDGDRDKAWRKWRIQDPTHDSL